MSRTETQTEALRLADQLRALSFGGTCILASGELRRLDAEVRDLKMAVSHESLCVEAAKERIRQLEAQVKSAAEAERERICAAIKAEDDYCITQGDYMLDSDDCIKVARGEWERPVYEIEAAAKTGDAA